jgi:hypothetical protein
MVIRKQDFATIFTHEFAVGINFALGIPDSTEV